MFFFLQEEYIENERKERFHIINHLKPRIGSTRYPLLDEQES